MDEKETELTRQAINEIVREMQQSKRYEEIGERKVNPLRKSTNKRFLGRTLSAMVSHNKRADEQNRRKCRKKLKELDRGNYSMTYQHSSKKRGTRKHKKDGLDTSDDSSDQKIKHYKKKHKKTRYKKKRNKSTKKRSSSESIYQSNSYLTETTEILETSNYKEEVGHNTDIAFSADILNFQMQQFYQYKALMALGTTSEGKTTENPPTIELNSNSSSLSDIKLDESSDSTSCNEILTIVVSTDDEKFEPANTKRLSKQNCENLNDRVICPSINLIDSDSAESIVSIESKKNSIELAESL